jgi:DNA-binding response OmpR family regulator
MKTILCVDDDGWVLDALMQALKPRGYRVLATTSTRVIPNALKYEKVDLVLLDLNMPAKHGLVVFRELEATAPVPVLFVTACSRSFRADAAAIGKEYEKEFQLARTDLLPKPFTLKQLYEKVESLIGSATPGGVTKQPSLAPPAGGRELAPTNTAA